MFATKEKSLSLKNYYFDAGTTVYALVRVKVDYTLSIHSLGLNSAYVLNFLVEPLMQDIKEAKEAEDIEYVYYVLKVTLDRSMEQTDGVTTTPGNENPEYVLHPEKAKNITSDILSGYGLDYYDAFFDMYVSSENTDYINFSGDNYITAAYSGRTKTVKVVFDKNTSYKYANAFSFSRTMAESIFYWLAQEGAFVGTNKNTLINLGTISIATGKTFKFEDYIDDSIEDKYAQSHYYDAIRKYLVFVFNNICYCQEASSAMVNFNTAMIKLQELIGKVCPNFSFSSYSLNYFNYYMTVSGHIYINPRAVTGSDGIFSMKIPLDKWLTTPFPTKLPLG